MPPTVEIEIPPRPGYVGVVRLALASLARTAGMDEERVDELKIAVSEACTNALAANEEAGSGEALQIRWTQAETSVIVEVEDRAGNPDRPNLEDSQGFSTRHAMAVALLQSLADEYQTSQGDDGSVTRMSFTL